MQNRLTLGIFLALSAAALNSTIGIFSKVLIEQGLTIEAISFIKTIIAFVLVSIVLFRQPQKEQQQSICPHYSSTVKLWGQIAFCAFLGVFVMFFFETLAYQYGQAANVVVVLMASAAVSALIGGWLLLAEPIVFSAIVGTLIAILGIFIISWSGSGTWQAVVNASLAGIGYGLFSVFIKRFRLNGGLPLTKMLMFFGAIYLLFPFIQHFETINWSWSIALNLLALAVLPTLLGFYCTTKALVYLSAAKVQVTELSEPIFSMCLAWLFLSEIPTLYFFIGAVCIVLGIILINQLYKFAR
ncbi:DMT family transporter [Gallibacterium anatis]|uniref:DMT family transporter n=3 Tax=Gallibacterium anatis TaxID=750 RepID=A0A0A2Z498_9PAST|nr:DMT family transporter [Gallibacterium anatis]ERF78197.1 permease [Gallibacterium anatis 12656/12]KGQ23473.1 permease [Gallibacterium anatis]KGQ24349.1 permease [Gallibacterium anatis CCM5995]KGQ28497.1 permease [Gallibacterium anatis]KGQ30321.1 permease [Gallibacterium anatis]